MSSKLLYNCRILTMVDENIILNGGVGIIDECIAMVATTNEEVERFRTENPSVEEIDCKGRLIMPGLINTHTHASMSLMRNLYEDMELMKWLNEGVWPFEAKMSEDDIEAGARLSIAEMLLGGTTTFVDMYFSMSRVAKAAEDMGIRALLTETLIVGREESFRENLAKLYASTKYSSRVRAGVAPHAPYTIPPPSAKVAKEEAQRYNLPINTHLCETSAERDMIGGKNPVTYFDECGLLTPSTILAHCVYVDKEDRQKIKDRGCSIAHCAESNMKLASGVAPIKDIYTEGINCTIGTDGVCSNNDLDMWGEMRSASLLQRVATLDAVGIPAFEILKMGSVNGAKAIGMAGELGVIKEGALADIIMVDITKPHHRPHNNIISSLVYCAKPSDVVMSMVSGKILVWEGELIGADVEELCQDVEQRGEVILGIIRNS